MGYEIPWLAAFWVSQVVGVDARPTSIVNGAEAEPCAWPSVAALTTGSAICTGALIHPRVLTMAGHCTPGLRTAWFGEQIGRGRGIEAECVGHPSYSDPGDTEVDFGYCVLAEPVYDIPIVPPLLGCETDAVRVGSKVTVVGFGGSRMGGDGAGSGRKRYGETEVKRLEGPVVRLPGGEGLVSACPGDSGGPALVQVADGSWRVLATVSASINEGCGGDVVYVAMTESVPWIEAQTGIDVSPCHDADGIWAPTAACRDFFAGDAQGQGGWADSCAGTPVSGPAQTCGAPFDYESDATAPTVSVAEPEGGWHWPESPFEGSLTVEASDAGVGVRRVTLSIGDTELGVFEHEAPYVFEGLRIPEGAWALVATAEDWAGNVAQSSAVTLSVGVDPPGGGGMESSEDGGTDGGQSAAAASGCRQGRGAPVLATGFFVLVVGVRRRVRDGASSRASSTRR